STGTNPARSSSRRAAEYFAAQPPHEARSVSFTRPVSMSTASPPDVEPGRVGIWTAFVYRLRSVQLVTRGSHAVFPPLGLPRPLEAACPDKKAATPERRRRQGRGGALTVPP